MIDGLRRPQTSRSWDVLLALFLLVISASILTALVSSPWRLVLGLGVVSTHVLSLAARRVRPVGVAMWMSLTALLFVAAGYPVVGLGPAALVAVYTVGAYRQRAVSLPTVAVASATMVVAVAASGNDLGTVLGNLVAFAAAWFMGDVSRRAKEREAELARTREELARQAVVEERLRIARELHDIVAHALSVIAVQSGTGRMVVTESPHLAARALGAIEETSRTALEEMRRLLDVLRVDDVGTGRSPSLGLDRIDELAADAASAGLDVDVNVHGERRPLPAGADAAACRILQEALTNVRKHAKARTVHLLVHYRPDEVELEVADDGCGVPGAAASERTGLGLIGMRERAALYGGRVDAGPGLEGGFVVRARIPVPPMLDGVR